MKKKLIICGLCLMFIFASFLTTCLSPRKLPPLTEDELVVIYDVVSGDVAGKAFYNAVTYHIEPDSQAAEKLREIFSRYTYCRSLKNIQILNPFKEAGSRENGVVPWYVKGESFCWINITGPGIDLATAGTGEISLNGETYTMTAPAMDNDRAFVNEIRALLTEIPARE